MWGIAINSWHGWRQVEEGLKHTLDWFKEQKEAKEVKSKTEKKK